MALPLALEATKLRMLVAGDWVEHELPAGVTVASTGQPEVALTPGQDVQVLPPVPLPTLAIFTILPLLTTDTI